MTNDTFVPFLTTFTLGRLIVLRKNVTNNVWDPHSNKNYNIFTGGTCHPLTLKKVKFIFS